MSNTKDCNNIVLQATLSPSLPPSSYIYTRKREKITLHFLNFFLPDITGRSSVIFAIFSRRSRAATPYKMVSPTGSHKAVLYRRWYSESHGHDTLWVGHIYFEICNMIGSRIGDDIACRSLDVSARVGRTMITNTTANMLFKLSSIRPNNSPGI